ncbi:RNA polymerase sigma factor [Actinoplanes xinjiangensis]|jgi:RNA polymerase sigma factor (sigma-70 family)|uniref:RNA polymerase sigma factor (Sigma-70 family) n=1 Tax=Actinoplanes xinjiangensis TaxID=512350 RepID=A0A316F6Q6_9ACTN|nr:sigma-70 family RNA polymerase sigma factor [Actinoplanes xinjiangensis]PWK40110.1 RNA polymerase sigma factor (sigma-70 family) [Actinoplanes xinjiangensis]GIF42425.1 RNA polymerase sigma factor [Actinoplanes xinjiangensis]
MEPEETAALVRRAAAGDASAWEDLVRAYAGLVWSVARAYRLGRADAEDVSQTTWERFARSLDKLTDPGHAGAWLSTTARRESLRVLAARNRMVPTGDLAWIGPAREDESPEEIAVAADEEVRRDALAGRLWQALNQLGDNCQRLLRVLMGEPAPSYADAAAALGVPIGYLGPTRRRCLEKLRKLADVSEPAEQGHDW